MYRNGRPLHAAFDPSEKLYLRIDPEWVRPDNSIDPPNIRCVDFSSNREKFSEIQDALYPLEDFEKHAVFACAEDQVPRNAVSQESTGSRDKPTTFVVRTEHDPQDDNYGHCETRFYRNGTRMRPNQVKHSAKMKFRIEMSHVLLMVRPPNMPLSPDELAGDEQPGENQFPENNG